MLVLSVSVIFMGSLCECVDATIYEMGLGMRLCINVYVCVCVYVCTYVYVCMCVRL